MAAAIVPKFVGTRVKRREDPRLISGNGTYVDDVRLPGMLTAVILRSPYGHAQIKALELDAARAVPGVVAVLIHEKFGTNIANRTEVSSGEIDRAMREADRVLKFRLVNQRLAPIPPEPRGTVAQWNAGSGQLTLWSSTQGPHLLRSYLAEILKLGENRLRVIAPEVGGGFGCKLNVYAEEVLTAHLAMTLRRPVKWIERRRDNLAGTTHGRDLIIYVEAPIKNDGTLLGLNARFICDAGAYLQLLTPLIPGFAGLMMTGCYKVPALAFEQLVIFTNKMATDAYRGAGRPEAAYIAERTIDMIAAELNLDPAEVRRKNFIVCVVEVDPETGLVKFLRYVAVDDCGKIINPLLVEGQLHGGIAQGIAQALYEEVIYDENGQLLTATLMDYAVPKAHMLPRYELDNTITPSPVNPLGIKGVGEAGTIGSTPCVVNAVHDTLRPLGIKNLDMPLKPERLWRAIQAAGKA